MEATGFFNMYRIVKAYPDLIEYRKPAAWYLEKAYGIYSNRVGTGAIGFYGEQQIPDMIEALYAEGMDEEAFNLQERFAWNKANNCINATIRTAPSLPTTTPVKRAPSPPSRP